MHIWNQERDQNNNQNIQMKGARRKCKPLRNKAFKLRYNVGTLNSVTLYIIHYFTVIPCILQPFTLQLIHRIKCDELSSFAMNINYIISKLKINRYKNGSSQFVSYTRINMLRQLIIVCVVSHQSADFRMIIVDGRTTIPKY